MDWRVQFIEQAYGFQIPNFGFKIQWTGEPSHILRIYGLEGPVLQYFKTEQLEEPRYILKI